MTQRLPREVSPLPLGDGLGVRAFGCYIGEARIWQDGVRSNLARFGA